MVNANRDNSRGLNAKKEAEREGKPAVAAVMAEAAVAAEAVEAA